MPQNFEVSAHPNPPRAASRGLIQCFPRNEITSNFTERVYGSTTDGPDNWVGESDNHIDRKTMKND
jgi:hypothetical protein